MSHLPDGLIVIAKRDCPTCVLVEPLVRSGLHQHRGVATSFFASGGLTDLGGPAGVNQVGINRNGSTHDAIAYQATLLVARLEGPVWRAAFMTPHSNTRTGSRSRSCPP